MMARPLPKSTSRHGGGGVSPLRSAFPEPTDGSSCSLRGRRRSRRRCWRAGRRDCRRLAGAIGGSFIDRALFGSSSNRQVEGPRLADLEVMASTEGAPIPRVYGRARLAGQVIWATPLEEVVSVRDETDGGGGKGGSGNTTTTTTYSYFANFAVGVCAG